MLNTKENNKHLHNNNNNHHISNKSKSNNEYPIIINLTKQGSNYVYVSDSLQESSKIKIPIDVPINNNQQTKKDKHYPKKLHQNNVISFPNHREIESETLDHEGEAEANIIKTQIDKIKNTPLLVPSCSQWFDLDCIHEIEMNSLPEFFCGKYPSKTPEVYKEYRNFIVGLYRENPHCYLSATVCRRQLVGDVCGILRLHAFLENWGLINFNVDPIYRPSHPYLIKGNAFKNPIYIDANSLSTKEDNIGIKVGENKLILTNKEEEEIKSMYPINNIPDSLFRNIFNKNNISPVNHMNFIIKNYRFKCENCSKLCGLFFYLEKQVEDFLRSSKVICEECFKIDKKTEKNRFNQDIFECTSIFHLLHSQDMKVNDLKDKLVNEKWSDNDIIKLVELVNKHGDNWDEIAKEFNGKRTREDCILQFLILPIKENVNLKIYDVNANDIKNPQNISVKLLETTNATEEINKKESEIKNKNDTNGNTTIINNNNYITVNTTPANIIKDSKAIHLSSSESVNDLSNPIISQIVFFSKMFQKFVEADQKDMIDSKKDQNNINDEDFSLNKIKETIYKTYSKSLDNGKQLQFEEKSKMKMILDMLIHTQLKKIELKLDYFNEFEKLLEFESGNLKSAETNIIQDKIKFAIKKVELQEQVEKFKLYQTQMKSLENNSNINTNSVNNSQTPVKNSSAAKVQNQNTSPIAQNPININNNSSFDGVKEDSFVSEIKEEKDVE